MESARLPSVSADTTPGEEAIEDVVEDISAILDNSLRTELHDQTLSRNVKKSVESRIRVPSLELSHYVTTAPLEPAIQIIRPAEQKVTILQESLHQMDC